MIMFIVSMIKWWYGGGWFNKLRLAKDSLAKTEDFFSIGLLVKTLFAPFRQISASSGVNDTIGEKLRAAFDKLFSRIIGAIMRTGMIIFGIIALTFNVILLGVGLITWPIIPLLPIVGVILSLSGWVPIWS